MPRNVPTPSTPRRAWPVILAAFSLLAMTFGVTPLRADASGAPGSFDLYTYSNSFGTRTYRVYVPPGYTGAPLPLLLELHGCAPDTAEVEARWSRFNTLAAKLNFLVAYPQQDTTYQGTDYANPTVNGSGCWNWFRPEDWNRDQNEPALLAGVTGAVMKRWSVDNRRVYVGGISAGGAMANVMAVTYPDIFAAALIYAGCEYMATANCLGSVSAVPGNVSGQFANTQMGTRARVVPVIVIQGDSDPVVPFPNSVLVIQQWLASDALATGGSASPLPPTPTATVAGSKPGGQSYTVEDYRDASGCLLVQRWLVQGMMHQWSDTPSDGSTTDTIFTDPAGPDVTTPIYQFFMDHPMPPAGTRSCYRAAGASQDALPQVLNAGSNPPLPSVLAPTGGGAVGHLLLAAFAAAAACVAASLLLLRRHAGGQ
ncbi:MAG: extracellular catalytic domain type 1 short-chain-length polyhydroxyalkanoate depolymerase [Candidatus Dormibacteria bacterium]